jgi:uncharacterized protein YfaS (alpha-2-macroglobulin family)
MLHRPGLIALLGLLVSTLLPVLAARVDAFSPQGTVADVRQISVRFDRPVVPAGDPRLPAPFTLQCNGATPPGDGRWANERLWLYDLRAPLPPGQRCTLQQAPGWQPLQGRFEGPAESRFETVPLAVRSVRPYPGGLIEEEQHFLLQFNGPADARQAQAAFCEVEGLGERMPVRVIDGPPREQLLAAQRLTASAAAWLLVACQRPFPAEAGVRLVWGRSFEWKVRPRFLAEFRCERERANAPCMPLRPLVVRFSAPVPRASLLAARLLPVQGAPGAALLPQVDDGAVLNELRFAAPLAENQRYRIALPRGLQDEGGRALANAAAFPMDVATGPLPPLAKFPGAPFGIVETGPEAMLPLTLRHVQADLQGASTGGRVALKRLDASAPDVELMRWMGRLATAQAARFESRETALLAAEADARRTELPQLKDSAPRATEVIGIPLPQRGYHVVEVESRILGESLLAQRGPMFVRTGVLVTNLAVHFKRGRTSSLAWVTTLDRGRPVAGARIVVNDCRGQPLWSGSTDAAGIARIERGFDEALSSGKDCLGRDGLMVSARAADDLAFVYSDWNRGIEPWRFNLPTAQGTQADRRAHTVFDRTLLRRGETVAMKHFVRDEVAAGLAWPAADGLPDTLVLTHLGSGNETALPLAWPQGARAAESTWAVPATAALGSYDVSLRRGDRVWRSGSLRVEAFRVPLVDARLSAPQGPLIAPRELVLNAQLALNAGGPLAGAPATLSALLRPKPPRFAGFEDHSFQPPGREPAADDQPFDDGSRVIAERLPANTNAQGAAQVLLKDLPPLAGPSELVAELTFDDPNGEVQTASQRVPLWPSAVVVGLRVRDWTASRGQARFSAVVLDTAGQPLKGREVEVSGRLHTTLSTRKRIVGGFYAYDNQRQTRELGVLCKSPSDAKGRVECATKLDVVGEVELVARARDDAGRVAEAAASVWVSGAGEQWFAQDNDDRIDVLPEQREVAPGDTARLQVRLPFREATALVTVEREGVIDARVLTLRGREPVVEVAIPKAASWAPNVIVSVLVLRGRLRDAPWTSFFGWGWREPLEWWRAFRYEGRDYQAPTAMVDLSKPSFKFGAAQLKVGLAEHRLDVKVTPEKAQYSVRETVKTRIKVTRGGQPVPGAEIAFAAVDEGLLALQPNDSWDVLAALMQPRPWGVETATAQGEIIGRRHYGRKALPPGGGGGRNPTRELFDTRLLWRGTVALDARGEAVIDVPLNDSLTSFRLVAIADAGVDRFGTGSASVRVTQDLQMLPGLPPLAREGDRFDASFTLRNSTAQPMTVKATLAGAGQTQPAQTVTLAPGAAAPVSWPVTVPAGVSSIEWTGMAEAGGARDRVMVVQTVQPAVPVRVWQASLQPLQGTLTIPLAPPADALPGSGGVNAALQPRLSGALPGLRRFFETYQYTCIEQQASRAIALHDDAAWARLQGELPGYLDSDGLAHYFPPRPGEAARGSDRLTAYLVTAAHEAGLAWPAPVLERMLQGLAAFVEGRIERRFNAPRPDLEMRKLAALDALARHGRATPRMLGSIAWTPSVWPTSALLDAWSLLERLPATPAVPERAARLAEVQRLLRARLVQGGTTLRFSTEDSDRWWWLMDGPDANAARLVLLAADAPAWKAEVPALVTGTLARQRQGAWATTTANLWGVLALERFSARFEATPVGGRSTLAAGGQSRTLDWQATPAGGSEQLPWGPVLQATHGGAGRPWLTVQTLAAVPLKAPLAAGYRITRSVMPVQRRTPEAWSRGDILRVRLEVEALGDMAWVVFSDPLPAGAAVLGGGLGRDSAIATRGEQREGTAWLAFEERGADTWRSYFEWLPRGRHAVEYTLRLNTSGRFALPPTRVEAMYAPETFGEVPNTALDVRP